jgi:3-oxocholest-4-en-26-oate---CoA ligase
VLRAIRGVSGALVIGRPSERWGHEIVAVVSLSEPLADAHLRDTCAQHLARYKLPKAFFRTALSLRPPNGKADYAAARDIVRRS